MECEIVNNQTRYPSEDILAVLASVREYLLERMDDDANWKFPTRIRVRSWSSTAINENFGVRLSREEPYYYAYGFEEEVCLSIAAPKHLPENDPIRSLVHAADGKVMLPVATVEAVARWYVSNCYMHRQAGMHQMVRSVELPEIRVQNRVVDPVKKVTKSTEEKLASYAEKHGDPVYCMQGSSRTPAYHWQHEMRDMANYYEREWERREKWRQKILKLGGEREAHIDFPTYLIWVGKYHQKHGRFPW